MNQLFFQFIFRASTSQPSNNPLARRMTSPLSHAGWMQSSKTNPI